MSEAAVPFRWNIARREQLGRLVIAPAILPYLGFDDDLRRCGARVLALAGDARLVFVGRSPELLFDFLSGLLRDTSMHDRLSLLQLSMRGGDPGQMLAERPSAVMALSDYFASLGLDPRDLRKAPRPVAFVDLVAAGDTFGALTGFLALWAREVGVDWKDVQRRLRYVGIVSRTARGPKTWRWHQKQDWIASVPDAVIRNVSVDWWFWDVLGNSPRKTTEPYHAWRWGKPDVAKPRRDEDALAGLALAVAAYDLGTDAEQRRLVARALAKERTVTESWLRNLILELKGRR